MDDLLKVASIIVILCFASALASWDPSSLLDDNKSPVEPETEGSIELGLNVSFLDWGELFPGAAASRAVMIQNMGGCQALLSFLPRDWIPVAAARFLNLSWDQEGTLLDPGETVAATFRLEVSWYIRGIPEFSFSIVICGSEP